MFLALHHCLQTEMPQFVPFLVFWGTLPSLASFSLSSEMGSPKRLVLLAEVEDGARSGAWLAEG